MTISVTTQADELLAVKRDHIWPCVFHFYRNPPVIVRGEAEWLYDSEGQRYLDCFSGVGVMNAGHSNPLILAAATEQMGKLCHTTTIYLTQPVLELAERLAEILPGDLSTSFFCASGSEAIEAAMLMASLKTERHEFVSFENGLHGRTKAAMSATALPMWKTDTSPLNTCHHAPHFNSPDCMPAVERLLSEHQVAAVLIEPIQGNGGIQVPPEGFLKSLQETCRRHGVLLIADEVQTGFNRTGDWLASTGMGVTPDIVAIAKGLGNGFPIAAAVTTPEIAASYRRPGASTFGGNPVSAAAALAVLRYHDQKRLGPRAIELGEKTMALLHEHIGDHPLVNDIRGRGLMIGVELNVNSDTDNEVITTFLETMKDEGYLLGRTGPNRNVITIMPPLVVNQESLSHLVVAIKHNLPQTF